MNIDIAQLSPIRVAMIGHRGPYDEISAVFDQLWAWVERTGAPAQRLIGVYWDNPDYTASSQLRSAACVEVPDDFELNDRGGAPIEIWQIAGGSYATTRFIGPYERLAPVWSEFTRRVERDMRMTIGSDPAFEVYVNDPEETPSSQLITDLYMPAR
jgi:AraC family transcriptional regulator